MVKKSTKKKVAEKKNVPERVPKKILDEENKQMLYFFIVIVLIFASFLGPYLYVQSLRTFDFSGARWTVERLGTIDVYHGRFPSINLEDINYNLYLKNDPRLNEVVATGEFTSFKDSAYISISEEIDNCRGEVSRIMVDLASFLKQGVGSDKVFVGATTREFAKSSGNPFVVCSNSLDGTGVIITMGEEGSVVQSSQKSCYEITVTSCNDVAPIEKFMLQVISDNLEEN